MIIDDVYSSKNYYLSLKRDLKETYQIDMDYFESLPINNIKILENASTSIVQQSQKDIKLFDNNSSNIPITKLNEALRIFLKEIYPQKNVKFKENLENAVNYKPISYSNEDRYKLEKDLVEHIMRLESNLDINNVMAGSLDAIFNPCNGNLKEGEMDNINKLAKLTENVILQEAELQRAEIVLATKDIVSRLQKQIEDIAGMATDDVLPLVDGMKENFGSPTANSFAKKAEEALQTASDSVQNLRDLFDSYARALEKHISDGSVPNDMSLGDEVAVEPEAEPEVAPAPEEYEKKTPEEALMGEGKDSKFGSLTESQRAAIKFAQTYNKSPMPLYLLSESEKRQLKVAAKILKGL